MCLHHTVVRKHGELIISEHRHPAELLRFYELRTWRDADADLEPRRQRAQELDPDAEADQRGHGTVRDGGRELHIHCRLRKELRCYYYRI